MTSIALGSKFVSVLLMALLLFSIFSFVVIAPTDVNISDTATSDDPLIPIDTTPPAVIDHSPAGNNVSVNASIRITFSEAMNEPSVEDAFSIRPAVDGSFNWHGNEMTFFQDNLSYNYNTTYCVTIKEEAADLAGNNLESSYRWEFTTESQETISPSPSPSPSPLPSPSPAPQIPILISNVSAVNITTNSATITWITDQPSDSLVK